MTTTMAEALAEAEQQEIRKCRTWKVGAYKATSITSCLNCRDYKLRMKNEGKRGGKR